MSTNKITRVEVLGYVGMVAAVAVWLMVAMLAGYADTGTAHAGAESDATAFIACSQEDGSLSILPCVWDGSTAGNGTGDVIVWDTDGSDRVEANRDAGGCEIVERDRAGAVERIGIVGCISDPADLWVGDWRD